MFIVRCLHHECNSDCQNCDFSNTRDILSDCIHNEIRLADDLCQSEYKRNVLIMIAIMNLCVKNY